MAKSTDKQDVEPKTNHEAIDQFALVQRGMNDDLVERYLQADEEGTELNKPQANSILKTLYMLKENVHGRVQNVNVQDLCELCWMTPEDVKTGLADLTELGEIVRRRRWIVLMNWRAWMGGATNVERDNKGLLVVNKGMVRPILDKLWSKMPEEVLAAYLQSCGVSSLDDLQAIADAPSNRGGNHKAKQSVSKRSKAEQSVSKYPNEEEEEREPEPEQEGGEGKPPPPPLGIDDCGTTETTAVSGPVRSRRRRPETQQEQDDNRPVRQRRPAKAAQDTDDQVIQLADAFARKFLKRNTYGNISDKDQTKFKEAVKRLVGMGGQFNTNLRHLLDCITEAFEGTGIAPGNLSSDYTWANLMPQYIARTAGG